MSLLNLFGNKKIDKNEAKVQLAPGQAAPGLAGAVAKLFDKNEKEVSKLRPTVEKIASYGPALKALSDDELKAKSQELKDRFKARVTEILGKQKGPDGEPFEWQELKDQLDWTDAYHAARRDAEKIVLDELLPEAFALTREAGDRTIGLRHFDVQMIGGAVLHSGRIGEMRTGEGKTLVATLPAYLNALTGRGVHVVTVNDYLAERDANWMRPIYEFLGLTVSFLSNDMQSEQRKPAYECDVLYCTNSEVGFDYLRDNMARAADDVVQRVPNFAIVDEVDNILIDEARTPLIISAQVAKSDRALRRQQMAKTCDGLGRKLMPSGSDRDVEVLQDALSARNRIDIDGLMQEIRDRGAFEEATAYLVDAYLLSERSARIDTAARLLDAADELEGGKLVDEPGAAFLHDEATRAVNAAELATAWGGEVARLAQPYAEAFAAGVVSNGDAAAIAHYLSLGEDATLELEGELADATDKRVAVANTIAGEVERRGLVDSGAPLAAHLLELTADSAKADADGDLAEALLENAQRAIVESLAGTPGAVQRADALLSQSLPGGTLISPEDTRELSATLEEISLAGGLPFETTERLWEAVRLPHGADGLRELLVDTIKSHSGAATKEIEAAVTAHSTERKTWLEENAAALAQSASPAVAAKAARGENATELRRALQTELGKSGAFADALKVAKSFVSEQTKALDAIAGKLMEELGEWVELPANARKGLVGIMAEGGKTQDVRDNLLAAVRDLPGDNSELPALTAEAARQIEAWRIQAAPSFVEDLSAKLPLTEEGEKALIAAIEEGDHADSFEAFAGEQLLASPQIVGKSDAVEAFTESWDAFRATQNERLLDKIGGIVEIGPDLRDALGETLDAPHDAKELQTAIVADFASDSVSRHLEPLLTDTNAPAFADEIIRRIPLSKDTAKRVKAENFVGKSGEQLRRALLRLVEQSFTSMPFEDFKRVIKNLAFLTEKDEKRRTAALTDMGTLIAEREAGTAAFSDPDGFLETLIGSEILTDEEGGIIRRAQAESPGETITSIIDRTLRLPAERRRRLAEAKLQEVQSVLDQSIKAHALFHREVHYVVDQGKEIVIVDEFTGRKMPGRRFSEGLHEALEAKQGLEVQLESQTVATITIQNYFRLYNKLAGMTGTAKTEEQEFAKTYGIEVVSIPTNKPIRRQDFPDVVYKTEEAKFRAITFDILEHHCAGQPVLAGTRSVEVSERMSERLKAAPLQMLVLQHLIKQKLWEDKATAQAEKEQIFAGLNAPIVRLNPAAIKNVAKQWGVNPDPMAEENLNVILGLFTTKNPSRERLSTALKNGLAHNVLNAKNHRNEARIVAEAARPASVTIATNMAGRGVDIVLGGTLDVESRWRVMTLQLLARTIEGKAVHVRSRNDDTTGKLVTRLEPENLQNLAWVTALTSRVHQLEASHEIEGLVGKDLRDTLAVELTAGDLKNRVRARVRRHNLNDKLDVDAEPTSDATLDALNSELQRLLGRAYDRAALKHALENGIAAQSSGRDQTEEILLHALARPLTFSLAASDALIGALENAVDYDRLLLQAAADSGATSFDDVDSLVTKIGKVTADWVRGRLAHFGATDAASARAALGKLTGDTIEVNELALLEAVGEAGMGAQWLRERLNEWGIVSDLTGYEVPPEVADQYQDHVIVHGRLDNAAVSALAASWRAGGDARNKLVAVEAPNLVILGDIAQMVGEDAPFLSPEWLHYSIGQTGIVSENDVFEAQMLGQAQDEQGNIQEMPVDVLVYRVRLAPVIEALKPSVREISKRVDGNESSVIAAFDQTFPWARTFVDDAWIKAALSNVGEIVTNKEARVIIETGVAGQSTDITLEGEARPEDIAHTSEGDEVKEFGGLHIIGSERHESRRIDNQLRGRAGRQGDPGSSRFYVSLEDELWRLFGVRGSWMLSKWDEDEAVEHSWITKSVERAQKKVELNHFEGRKHTLQFDDVMNVQREVIYRERRRALQGADVRDTTLDMARRAAIAEIEKHMPRALRPEEWDTHKAYLQLGRLFGTALLHKHLKQEQLEGGKWTPVSTGAMGEDIFDIVLASGDTIYELVEKLYDERETLMGTEYLRSIERWQVTRSIDEYWMEHLAAMDYLRDAIWQESYAQKEPIGVYRQEGFAMFQRMLAEIRGEVTAALFAWQLPGAQDEQLQLDDAAIDMGELTEARLIQDFPLDADDLEDGEQLNKDADGDEAELEYAGVSPRGGAAVATPKLQNPMRQQPQAPMSRAERRAAEKNKKRN